eukprot:2129655-Rhodomonas_salina.1
MRVAEVLALLDTPRVMVLVHRKISALEQESVRVELSELEPEKDLEGQGEEGKAGRRVTSVVGESGTCGVAGVIDGGECRRAQSDAHNDAEFRFGEGMQALRKPLIVADAGPMEDREFDAAAARELIGELT